MNICVCGNTTKWSKRHKQYNKYCSDTCMFKGRRQTQLQNGWNPSKAISKSMKRFYSSKKGEIRKKEISKQKRELFLDPSNHPMFGKKHSKESIEKNRQSNIYAWKLGKKKSCYTQGKICGKYIYRSSWERGFYFLLSKCTFLTFEVEPFSIPYEKGNYWPDVLIEYVSGIKHLIEIKPKKLQNYSINILKFNAAKKYILLHGINKFLVLGEGNLFKYLLLNDCSFIDTDIMKALDKFTSGLDPAQFDGK